MTEAATIPPVPKPAHVPDSVVYDFDMLLDEELRTDPHKRILDLVRNHSPLFWTPRNGGHWMLLSHSANFKASRDFDSFSSEFVSQAKIKEMRDAMPPGSPHIPQPLPINADPPAHTKYRTPLNPAFSPKAMLALRDSIRDLAIELVDAVKDRGKCELIAEIAEPLPVKAFLRLLGLPQEKYPEYRAIVLAHAAQSKSDPKESMMRLLEVTAAMRPIVLERKEKPQNDLISLLWQTKIDGEETTLEDLENYGVLLFLAGLDTVTNGMGLGIHHLATNLDLQEKLRANPKLVTEATEELLRRYTFTVPPRIVARDLEFEGVPMKKGDPVMLYLPAADLDAQEYPQPDQYDLNRDNKVHIAFGTGPHRCLGSHLARIELNVLYEQMLAQLPTFRLDPEHPPRFHGGNVIGPDTLHLIWD